uniref:Si:ch211-232p21.6 n=1 Tax=Sinocyclocheilus grahami TaxID=75366 RepID=A0A672RND0_SINGR
FHELNSKTQSFFYVHKRHISLKYCSQICLNLCLPEKWVQDKGRFYVFSNDTKDWNSSRQCCQDLGGDLVIINSSEEQEFLAQQIVTFNALVLHWIGLTDRQTEGVWLWVDNTPLNNNVSWHKLSKDHCAVISGYLKGEKWGDISCLKMQRSICEVPCS